MVDWGYNFFLFSFPYICMTTLEIEGNEMDELAASVAGTLDSTPTVCLGDDLSRFQGSETAVQSIFDKLMCPCNDDSGILERSILAGASLQLASALRELGVDIGESSSSEGSRKCITGQAIGRFAEILFFAAVHRLRKEAQGKKKKGVVKGRTDGISRKARTKVSKATG